MWKRREPEIELKTAGQRAAMRAAGLVVASALRGAAGAAGPGVSTADLDEVASETIRAAGAVPSFLGYHGFPATICTSVNGEVVHGIPRRGTRLLAGDVLSIDCGAIVDGWHADAALTVGIGEIPAAAAQLLAACDEALWAGLAQARAGGRLTDISHAVEQAARSAGQYGIVEDYVGHGIGSQMHMDPPVPNQGRPGRGPLLREGMVLAIEPLLTLGSPETVLGEDGWTASTADGGTAAHFEHTVAITADGPWVLTEPDGGAGRFRSARAPAAAASAALPSPATRI